jgi:hypothetical protein
VLGGIAAVILIWSQIASNSAQAETAVSPLSPASESVTLTIGDAASDAVWQAKETTVSLADIEQLDVPLDGEAGLIQSGNGLLQLTLPDETLIILAADTIVELVTTDELSLLLAEGRVLIQTNGTYTIANPFGASVSISNGLLGISFSQDPFRFDADCLIGSCVLTGDLQGERKLLATQHSYVGGSGDPSTASAVRYELYVPLSALVPTPTATSAPTETATATLTPTNRPTETATRRPSSTPTNTPANTPTPRPANTSTPTNTPVPPANTAVPPTSPPPPPPTSPPPPPAPPTETAPPP